MSPWNRLHTAASTLFARLRPERGQALVEFAVVLPLLMLIVMGIIYFGRYESYSSQMTQLAEEGARDAAVQLAVPSGYSSLAAYIQSQATGELAAGSQDVQQVSVRVDCQGSSGCVTTSGSNTVTVCLQANVQFPFLNVKVGAIEQQATMRVEQATTPYLQDSSAGPNPPSC